MKDTIMKQWLTPAGQASRLCLDMLKQPHMLIAGSTGSGKSVLINSLIYTALYKSPSRCQLILIDPKRVELICYKNLPHTLAYASEPSDIRQIIHATVTYMEDRYKIMQEHHQKQSTEAHAYLIIDELADLLTTDRSAVLPDLQRLAQLGRASNIHLFAATQRPTKDILSGQLKVNMDSRLALRCPTAQDSRNILDVDGAERLPRYGSGYYLTPETMSPQLVKIPYTEPDELTARVKWWEDQKPTTSPD